MRLPLKALIDSGFLHKRHNAQSLEERENPLFVIDFAIVKDTVEEFTASMPSTNQIGAVHFGAVKACAAKPVIDIYDKLGCGFDCAPKGEVKPLIDGGVGPARISLGKCNFYAIDSFTQIHRMLEAAAGRVAKRPGGDLTTILANLKPFCRLLLSGKGSEKPFSARFGLDPELALTIIKEAHYHGLTFVGLSGHPSTQNLAKDTFM
ncbi:hypothetical protein F53441_8489 [Fusarium austroafricanum]|uniref:Orn/DAP/Arg decarboxylase 2 N-terminal domain-containing protein n=1 Tax=Fusarium austroafricanum TaxID=2364996 RepID=A0A8H4KED7_9HYPO|nr:hypothetical protein F53441_8489 [Fusarium austroafricanum]